MTDKRRMMTDKASLGTKDKMRLVVIANVFPCASFSSHSQLGDHHSGSPAFVYPSRRTNTNNRLRWRLTLPNEPRWRRSRNVWRNQHLARSTRFWNKFQIKLNLFFGLAQFKVAQVFYWLLFEIIACSALFIAGITISLDRINRLYVQTGSDRFDRKRWRQNDVLSNPKTGHWSKDDLEHFDKTNALSSYRMDAN